MSAISIIRLMFLLVPVSVISACGTLSSGNAQRQQAIEQTSAPYADNAIKVDLKALPMLNAFHQQPNSCTVLIVQSQHREELERLVNNAVLIHHLFTGDGAINGVLKLDRYVMMPGQHVSLHIDRAEQARYVALIAGYYPEPDASRARIFPVPVKVTHTGIFSQRWQARLIPLDIFATLGRDAIIRSGGHVRYPGEDVIFPAVTEDSL